MSLYHNGTMLKDDYNKQTQQQQQEQEQQPQQQIVWQFPVCPLHKQPQQPLNELAVAVAAVRRQAL